MFIVVRSVELFSVLCVVYCVHGFACLVYGVVCVVILCCDLVGVLGFHSFDCMLCVSCCVCFVRGACTLCAVCSCT